MHIFILFCTLTCVVALPRARASLDPLLTSISKISDLSIFYSLFEGTGGDQGKPGPDFEERFNDPNIGLLFTAFAPTNDAFARLPPGLLSALTLPHSYELLKSVLLTHISPGNVSDAELENGKTLEMIEGFTATFDKDGNISTNDGLQNGKGPFPVQASLIRTTTGNLDCSEAFNGRICKVDGILDGFLTYFGEDIAYESTDLPSVTPTQGTMKDILEGSSELSKLYSTLKNDDPEFLNRLSLFSKDEAIHRSTIYLAPGNAAFDILPEGASFNNLGPSNFGQGSLLLDFGFGQLSNDSQVLRSEHGFDIKIRGRQAMNARISSRTCADNGCVWIISRALDPLLAFGAA